MRCALGGFFCVLLITNFNASFADSETAESGTSGGTTNIDHTCGISNIDITTVLIRNEDTNSRKYNNYGNYLVDNAKCNTDVCLNNYLFDDDGSTRRMSGDEQWCYSVMNHFVPYDTHANYLDPYNAAITGQDGSVYFWSPYHDSVVSLSEYITDGNDVDSEVYFYSLWENNHTMLSSGSSSIQDKSDASKYEDIINVRKDLFIDSGCSAPIVSPDLPFCDGYSFTGFDGGYDGGGLLVGNGGGNPMYEALNGSVFVDDEEYPMEHISNIAPLAIRVSHVDENSKLSILCDESGIMNTDFCNSTAFFNYLSDMPVTKARTIDNGGRYLFVSPLAAFMMYYVVPGSGTYFSSRCSGRTLMECFDVEEGIIEGLSEYSSDSVTDFMNAVFGDNLTWGFGVLDDSPQFDANSDQYQLIRLANQYGIMNNALTGHLRFVSDTPSSPYTPPTPSCNCSCNPGYTCNKNDNCSCSYACTNTQMLVPQKGCVDNKFQITTTSNTTSMNLYFYAAGTYYVDCNTNSLADSIYKITISDTQMNNDEGATVTCSYDTAGQYTIGVGGLATNYKAGSLVSSPDWHSAGSSNCEQWSVFKLSDSQGNASKVSSVSGRLGAIFPTISGKPQPSFISTFAGTNNMTSIPADVFSGVYGAPGVCMFASTFMGSGITEIPLGLFADISGTAEGLFVSAFASSKITSIDPGVFRNIKGAARSGMFDSTFVYTQLSELPENLFGGLVKVSGVATDGLFRDVFRQRSSGGIKKLPNRMFNEYNGIPDTASFKNMFANNTNLTGYVPYSFIETLNNTGYNDAASTSPLDSIFHNTGLATSCPKDMYQYITGFEGDFDGKVVCAHCPDGGSAPAGSVGIESCVNANVICEAGQFLASDETTCSTCPLAYPNSERGTRTINDCYATLTYVFNNGEENLSETFNYSANPNGYYASLPTPSWYEDVFDGWYKYANFTGGQVTKQTLFTNGNQTLYAKWLTSCPAGFYKDNNACFPCPSGYTSIGTETSAADCYKILSYIDSMDNSSYDDYGPGMCSVGEEFVLPTAPTKKGFNFIGWTLVQ